MVKSVRRDYKESWNPEIGKGLKGGIGCPTPPAGVGHESRSLLSLINESLGVPDHPVIHGAEKVTMEESTICLYMIHLWIPSSSKRSSFQNGSVLDA